MEETAKTSTSDSTLTKEKAGMNKKMYVLIGFALAIIYLAYRLRKAKR